MIVNASVTCSTGYLLRTAAALGHRYFLARLCGYRGAVSPYIDLVYRPATGQGKRRSAARLDGLVAKVPASSVDFVARHAAHLNLALDYFRNGRALEALGEMRNAERFALDAGRTVAAARARSEMGRVMNDLGRSRSALRLCGRKGGI